MAKDQILHLYRAVRDNPQLRDTLNMAPDVESMVTLANQQGFTFTIEEWQQTTGFTVEELQCEVSEIPGL